MDILTALDALIISNCTQHHLKVSGKKFLSVQSVEKHCQEKEMYDSHKSFIKQLSQEIDISIGLSESEGLESFASFMKFHLSSEMQEFFNIKNYNNSLLCVIFAWSEMILKYHDDVYDSDKDCFSCMNLVMKMHLLLSKSVFFRAIQNIKGITSRGSYLKKKLDLFIDYLRVIILNNYGNQMLKLAVYAFGVDLRNLLQHSLKSPNFKCILQAMQNLKLNDRYLIDHIFQDCLDAKIFSALKVLLQCETPKYLNTVIDGMCQNEKTITMLGNRVISIYLSDGRISETEYISDKDRQKTIKLLWDCIPHPFLTRECIRYCLRHKYKAKDKFPEKVWLWYDKCVAYGEGDVSYPRSLKHLARCSIRSSLAACYNLLNAIELLKCPKILKKYIALQDS